MSASAQPAKRVIPVDVGDQIEALTRIVSYLQLEVAPNIEDCQVQGQLELDISVVGTLLAQLHREGMVFGTQH